MIYGEPLRSVALFVSMAAMTEDPYNLSPKDVAAIVGVHWQTIKRWAEDGELPAFQTPGGWWRFRRSDVDAFLSRQSSRS